jgi:hypothetical protein
MIRAFALALLLAACADLGSTADRLLREGVFINVPVLRW